MVFARSVLLALTTALTASAHMNMRKPAPLTYQGNQYTPSLPDPEAKSPNYDITSPMNAAMFPCNVKNFNSYVETSASTPVETWAAGSQQTFEIEGGASHNGGSCQAVISEDNGQTWKVIEEYIGNCPLAGSYSFTVPKNTKSGKVLFGWTWFNHTGNREMYMNCAAITITGGGSGLSANKNMFVANVPGVTDCTTKEGVDIDFTESSCASGTPAAGSTSGSTGSDTSTGGDNTSTGGSDTSTGGNNTEYGDGTSASTPTTPATPTATAIAEDENTESNDDAAASKPSPTPAPILVADPTPTGNAGSNLGSNSGTNKKYDDGKWRPGSNSGKYDDGMWRPSASSGKYDNGMWSPEKYGKVKREFKIRGLGRGIFGGAA